MSGRSVKRNARLAAKRGMRRSIAAQGGFIRPAALDLCQAGHDERTQGQSILQQSWRGSTRLLTTGWSLRRALCQYPPSDFAEDAPKHHMLANDSFHIAVLPGDGIGPEVMAPALAVLEKVAASTPRLKFRFTEAPAGAGHYRDTGTSMPQSTIKLCEEADAILLGACGLPDIRCPDNPESMPQVELRFMFDLYAGGRPCRLIANVPSPIVGAAERGIDLVVIRESTEGLFASMGKGVVSDTEARETLLITRKTSERLFDFSFRLAAQRKARGAPGKLACVDKANAFKAYAFFRGMFDECAARYPDVGTDRLYVDACSAMLVRRPWDFDVLVMENMFGDIISDLTAGLIGGMGMAPSADIGDTHAVFQPCHGTAPRPTSWARGSPIRPP